MKNCYECITCKYITKDVSNLKRHNNTKKHSKNIAKLNIQYTENISNFLKTPENSSKLLKTPENSSKLLKTPINQGSFKCDSCGNLFVRANNLTRHYKICVKNNAEIQVASGWLPVCFRPLPEPIDFC